MNLLDKARTAIHIAKWRFTWTKHDLDHVPKNTGCDKFMSAREAVKLIDDSTTCISSGMAGNARCSIFFWALRDSYLNQQRPKNLTWVTVSAQGGRGRAPGTIEELEPSGLVGMHLSGHMESAKAILETAEKGDMELHTFPQGELTFLLEAQAKGQETIDSEIGVGTFLDPRVGNGSPVTPNPKHSFIEVSKDDPKKLTYRIPKIDVAMFSAPHADKEGNIYYQGAAVTTENTESALAAKKNGGKVMVVVCDIIEKNEAEISLPADQLDVIVVNPWNEQTAAIKQRKFWPMFTRGGMADEKKSIEKLKFINQMMGITPKRVPTDNSLSRMAASLFTEKAFKGALINFGIGLPEEVGRLLFEGGLYHDLICSSETGAFNGLPAPGIYFGAAINPKKMYSSAWIFDYYKKNLDVAVLGLMQADSEGNVNVSHRGPKVTDFVGPGGFLNIAASAKTVIFVGRWMAKAQMSITDGNLSIDEKGIVKFIEKVDKVTFNAKQALEMGKEVFYVTNVGIFKLTDQGMELIQVTPGIDIQKDIVDVSQAKIIVPDINNVPLVPKEVMTGNNFNLEWKFAGIPN